MTLGSWWCHAENGSHVMADTNALVYSTSTGQKPNAQRRREVRYVTCPTCGYEREAGYMVRDPYTGLLLTCGEPCV